MSSYKKIPLGEVASYINGYAFKPIDWGKSGLPIIRIQNLTDENKEFNYYEGNFDKKYLIKRGDILISWSASLGIYEWNKSDAILNQHIFKVIFDKIQVDKKYYFFVLKKILREAIKNTHGSTMKHITRPQFEKILFPFYELEKQKKIAKILENISNIIEKKKQKLQEYDELSKSIFEEELGDLRTNEKNWKFITLQNICDVRDGTHDSPKYVAEGYPLITSKNILEDKIDFFNVNYISKLDLEKINKRSKVDRGDILMPMIGTIGNPLIVDIEKEFAIKNVALLKFDKLKQDNIFIKEILSSNYFLSIIKEKNRGGTQKFLSLNDIRNISIPIVPEEIKAKIIFTSNLVQKSKFLLLNFLKV
jgi:type I restriction enzyme S subunit